MRTEWNSKASCFLSYESSVLATHFYLALRDFTVSAKASSPPTLPGKTM